MIQKPLSSESYALSLLSGLKATGISQTSEGGKARAIADTIADRLGVLEQRQFTNLTQRLLPYAQTDTLDFLGAIRKLPRIVQKDAQVFSSDNNFKFYVRYGTFGSINNGSDITVPAGTQLYTANGLNGVVYLTQVDVTLPAASTSIFFSAVAQTPGAGGQIASGVISATSYSGYADARYGSLLVTNLIGVISGVDKELDEDYRYRISLKVQATGGSQQTDVLAALLLVPGIQDVSFIPKAGTFIAYIYGISPSIGSSLLQLAQTAIDSVVAFPLSGLAVAPDLIGISLSTTATFASGTTASAITQILQTAAANVQSYIDNLPKGSLFVLNQVASQILNSDTRLIDIGQPNKPLNSIYIWRSRADGSRYSRSLIGDYSVQIGERLVSEAIVNAISITQAAR